jgi:hypothetical protein
MQHRFRRLAAVFAFGVLPFTLTACPGDDDGNAEVEDIAPDEDVDVSGDASVGEDGVDVEGEGSVDDGEDGTDTETESEGGEAEDAG